MTREEAIFTIEHRDGIMDYGETEQLAEALDMAIAALKAEPCEDVVSRKHLLSGIDELMQSPWFNHGKDDDMITHYGYVERKEAVEVVRDLCIKAEPSVNTEQNSWIPVSERLPEKDGEYITTMKYIGVATGTIYIDVEETFFDVGKGFNVGVNESVIAWMPLPEPYKAESEDKE